MSAKVEIYWEIGPFKKIRKVHQISDGESGTYASRVESHNDWDPVKVSTEKPYVIVQHAERPTKLSPGEALVIATSLFGAFRILNTSHLNGDTLQVLSRHRQFTSSLSMAAALYTANTMLHDGETIPGFDNHQSTTISQLVWSNLSPYYNLHPGEFPQGENLVDLFSMGGESINEIFGEGAACYLAFSLNPLWESYIQNH